jgi:hypothetical protein
MKNAALIVLSTILIPTLLIEGQVTNPTSAKAPIKSFGPITEYDSTLASSSYDLQIRRSYKYNLPGAPLLGEDSQANIFDLPLSHGNKPVSATDCDTIVTGSIVSGRAYLSADKHNIYSQFVVELNSVIKTPQTRPLSNNQSIEIHRKGGAVRLPSGKILRRGALNESMPEVGKRYLLLLSYDQDTNSFSLRTGYQLEGIHVYRLDELDGRAKPLEHPLEEEGITEGQLLERVKESTVKERR